MTSGRIGKVGSLGSGEQAGDDLRGKTIQPRIYIIQNRKAIRRAKFHLGMLGWGWTGSV
jgi:hypothetical protein